MAKSVSTPAPIKASPEARALVEQTHYWSPSDLLVLKKGHGADGKENLEIDETIIYSFLKYSARVTINGSQHAYGMIKPVLVTSWTGRPILVDGRQSRKNSDEINDRLTMIDGERKKLGEDCKDLSPESLAVLRNHCVQKAITAPKSWHWATEEAMPLYIGGRVGDAKQGFDAPGFLLPEGGYVSFVLWTVYQDIDPESIVMKELSSAAEHARKTTPPSKLAVRIQSMLTELPAAHVARIVGCTERSLQDKLLITKVIPEVQAAVDLGGEKGGISWNQMHDEMFKPAKGGGLVPLTPEEQLARLPEIAGTKKRGGQKGPRNVASPPPPAAAPAQEAAPPPGAKQEPTAPKVLKLRPEVLIAFASALEKGAESLDMDNEDSPDAKDDMSAMAAVLRFTAGDSEILDEFPVAKECLMAVLKKIGGVLANPVENKEPEIADDVKIATALLDLTENWVKTRKPDGDAFEPNWPQGDALSEGVKEALGNAQTEYRKHQTELRAEGNEPTDPEIWIEEWVNENLMKVKAKA